MSLPACLQRARRSPDLIAELRDWPGVLPLNGAILGAPGCYRWNEDNLLVGVGSDASGNSKITVMVPTGLGDARA